MKFPFPSDMSKVANNFVVQRLYICMFVLPFNPYFSKLFIILWQSVLLCGNVEASVV